MSKDINLNLKDLPKQLAPFVERFRKYLKFSYFVFMILICCFLVLQINRFASVEPDEDQVTEELQTVQRPKIDQASIDKIQQLQDQNVQVQSLFQDARANPFSE